MEISNWSFEQEGNYFLLRRIKNKRNKKKSGVVAQLWFSKDKFLDCSYCYYKGNKKVFNIVNTSNLKLKEDKHDYIINLIFKIDIELFEKKYNMKSFGIDSKFNNLLENFFNT